MSKAKTLVLRAPGTNCDVEAAFAFETAGADVSMVHIGELIRRDKELKDYQIMVLPGGFTYGDDLGSGKVIANEISMKLGDDVKVFVENGGLIIGICNGFQILVKSGLLPDPSRLNKTQKATLTNNDSGKFECRWVNLKVNTNSKCIFTKGIEKMYLPVAHGEGKFVADEETLASIDVAIRYADAKNEPTTSYPDNPNGSLNCICLLAVLYPYIPHCRIQALMPCQVFYGKRSYPFLAQPGTECMPQYMSTMLLLSIPAISRYFLIIPFINNILNRMYNLLEVS
jgi:phosphoribosylformylglycinamidine synthase I